MLVSLLMLRHDIPFCIAGQINAASNVFLFCFWDEKGITEVGWISHWVWRRKAKTDQSNRERTCRSKSCQTERNCWGSPLLHFVDILVPGIPSYHRPTSSAWDGVHYLMSWEPCLGRHSPRWSTHNRCRVGEPRKIESLKIFVFLADDGGVSGWPIDCWVNDSI